MNVDPSPIRFIEFPCPYCNSPVSFPETKLGTAQECPYCSENIVVVMPGSGKDSKLPVPINTLRLNLRPLKFGDLDDWMEFTKDESSYIYLEYNAPDDEEAKSWFMDSMDMRFTRPGGWLPFGIELRGNSKLIGYIPLSFNDPHQHQQGSFSLMVHPAYRRQGYGSEALAGLMAFAFDGIGLHDIRTRLDSRNVAGRRTAERSGMRLEGEFHEERRIKGEWVSGAYYAMIRSWWANVARH